MLLTQIPVIIIRNPGKHSVVKEAIQVEMATPIETEITQIPQVKRAVVLVKKEFILIDFISIPRK